MYISSLFPSIITNLLLGKESSQQPAEESIKADDNSGPTEPPISLFDPESEPKHVDQVCNVRSEIVPV